MKIVNLNRAVTVARNMVGAARNAKYTFALLGDFDRIEDIDVKPGDVLEVSLVRVVGDERKSTSTGELYATVLENGELTISVNKPEPAVSSEPEPAPEQKRSRVKLESESDEKIELPEHVYGFAVEGENGWLTPVLSDSPKEGGKILWRGESYRRHAYYERNLLKKAAELGLEAGPAKIEGAFEFVRKSA